QEALGAHQRVERVERLHAIELVGREKALAQRALAQVHERVPQRRAAEATPTRPGLAAHLAYRFERRSNRRHCALPTGNSTAALRSTGASNPASSSTSFARSISSRLIPLRRSIAFRSCSPSDRFSTHSTARWAALGSASRRNASN